MRDVHHMVVRLGGMAQKQQLVRLGASDYDLTRAVRSGSVRRARQGWYTTEPLETPAVRAVRVGGRLTGLSALVQLDAWAHRTPVLHVSVHRNSARLRSQWDRRMPLSSANRAGIRLHWDDVAVAARGTATSVAVEDALVRVILDESLEVAVAALDWALHTGVLAPFDFEVLIESLPLGLRAIRGWVDPNCGSFPESVARTRLRMRGLAVRSQVPVADIKAIDLVVEDTVGLEVDGEEFHRERFHADRTKDLEISLADLHAMRPSASIVFGRWPELLRSIELALAARGVAASAPPVKMPARRRARYGSSAH